MPRLPPGALPPPQTHRPPLPAPLTRPPPHPSPLLLCADGTVKYLKVQATCTGSSGGYQPASASAPVYAQAFVEKAGLGARKVLLVNTRASAQAVTVPGATGGTWRYVDESTGFGPPASAPWAADTLTLAPFALGVLRLPAAA